MLAAGCDDKANIPVGDYIPVQATARQSNKAIVQEDTTVEACDHDYKTAKVTPSVIHRFNQSTNPGDSLYSGGPDGTGRGFVSLHCAMLDPSDGMKHAANFHQFLQLLARENRSSRDETVDTVQGLPYWVLMECDGGPDHNLTFLSNQLALLGLFLVGGMDKLTATRGCPGSSYLNTAERLMSLLNIGLSSLSLMLDPNTPQWLRDILHGLGSMKAIRKALADYDDIMQHAIDALERRVRRMNALPDGGNSDGANAVETEALEVEESTEVEESIAAVEQAPTGVGEVAAESEATSADAHTDAGAKVGDTVHKFFPFFGMFEGEVTAMDDDGKIRIDYTDGDFEVVTQDQLDAMIAAASIPIGDVGYKFINKLKGQWFNGEVVRILHNEKRVCKYNDDKHRQHNLSKLEKYSKYVNSDGVQFDDEDEDMGEDDSEDDIVDIVDAAAEHEVADIVETEAIAPAPAPAKAPQALSGGLLKKLTRVPFGKTLPQHLAELKAQRPAREEYANSMDYPIDIIKQRFGRLDLDGRPVEVMKYAEERDVQILIDALTDFDPDYSVDHRSKTQLKKMPIIARFLSCPNHCRTTDFTFELRMCGVDGCGLCARFKRKIRTPDVVVNGRNLRQETIRWLDLPMPDPSNKDHFLSPVDAREYIDTNAVTFETLKKCMPDVKADSEEKKAIKESRKLDDGHTFNANKVRATIPCGGCGARRCVYSDHDVETKKGPSQTQLDSLIAEVENDGYVCGGSVIEDGGFFVKRGLRCGDYTESQYYNPKAGVKGGRIVTADICAICYERDDIVSADEIRKSRDIGGKNPLLLCRYCFDKNIEIPCSGGRTNQKQKTEQGKRTKRKQLDESIKSGRRKVRKNPSYAGDKL